MGLVSWLRERAWQAGAPGRARTIRKASRPDYRRTGMPARRGADAAADAADGQAAAEDLPGTEWEELQPYLPVDPAEHRVACVVASALAAGDRPESSFTIKRVCVANPEYQRVTCIATALAAGALSSSSFTIKRIYKQKSTEASHAA